MNTDKYPIVMIDRTTSQEILPMFMHRGLFSNYNSLPERKDILESARISLGVDQLSLAQEREVLSEIGEYKSEKFVFRDTGNYVIAFTAKLYLDYLSDLESKMQNQQSNSTNTEEEVEKALKRIRLYKLAHKVALIILSEAYLQRKFEEVEISKERILEYLGLDTSDKYIYSDIDDVVFSLRWLNYQIFQYKTKTPLSRNSTSVGNFIYNIYEDAKTYKFWINTVFVGCVEHLITDDKHKKEDRPQLFERGYIRYPTSLLPLTRDYSSNAYMLLHFLVTDSGNAKLRNGDCKVVAYKAKKLISEAKIDHSRLSVSVKELIDSLEVIDLIEKTEPTLDELKLMKPSRVLETIIKVYLKSASKALDSQIKSNLLCAKCG
jgi:hypothetical protein